MKTLYEMQVANRNFYNGYVILTRQQTSGFRHMIKMECAIKDGTYFW